MTKKYVLVGGPVVSRADGQTHFVSADRLVSLYGLNRRECVLTTESDLHGRLNSLVNKSDATVLYPRVDGDYRKPEPPPDYRRLHNSLKPHEDPDLLVWWNVVSSEGGDAPSLVFSDWLEENGYTAHAAYARSGAGHVAVRSMMDVSKLRQDSRGKWVLGFETAEKQRAVHRRDALDYVVAAITGKED